MNKTENKRSGRAYPTQFLLKAECITSATAVFSAVGTKTLSGTDKRHLSGEKRNTQKAAVLSLPPQMLLILHFLKHEIPLDTASDLHFHRHRSTIPAVPNNHPVSSKTGGVTVWLRLWSAGGTEYVKSAKYVKSTNQKKKMPLHYMLPLYCLSVKPALFVSCMQ